jgi:hypothetical protein
MDALIEGFAAGRLDRLKPVVADAAQDLDHLSVAVIAGFQLAPDCRHGRWQHPVLERRPIPQSPGFACQNRHIMPRVKDGLAAAEGARMLADDHPVLPDDDPLGIGMHIDGSTDRRGQHRVFVVVEAHGAGLRHRGGHAVEPIEGAGIGHQLRPLGLEHLPDRLAAFLGVTVRLGISHAFVEQPGVQLVEALDPQSRREEPFAHQPDLVLDLTLLPA